VCDSGERWNRREASEFIGIPEQLLQRWQVAGVGPNASGCDKGELCFEPDDVREWYRENWRPCSTGPDETWGTCFFGKGMGRF
jgi:hypothetical protein